MQTRHTQRAMNAHAELLAELQSLTNAVYDNGQWLSGPAYDRIRAFADRAAAAIARATEEQQS